MGVVVVGGGVVGLCVARQLAKRGADVTIVDAGAMGAGCSAGNAGWISPILAEPIPGPGVLATALRLSLRPSTSPLSIRPHLRPDFLRWSWRFARACSAGAFEAALRAAVDLNRSTFAAWDRLVEDGVEFEQHRSGILAGVRTVEALDRMEQAFRHVQDVGYPGRMERLGTGAIRELEPSFTDAITGGLLFEDERHVAPESVVAGLVADLQQRGADLIEHSPVTELRSRADGWEIRAGPEIVRADLVVVAAGVGTRRLLRGLGVAVPIEAARGYSFTMQPSGPVPARPLLLPELKVACSPYRDRVRFVGTFELGARSTAVSSKRIARVARAWSAHLRGPVDATSSPWAGLRPTTPDTLPILSDVPDRPGLFVASGHGMHGVGLAPVSAELLAPLVLDGERADELVPLSLTRFA